LDGAGNSSAQAGQVRTSINGVDRVGKGVNRFSVCVSKLDGAVDGNAIGLLSTCMTLV